MDPLFLEALATLETANGRKTIKGPQGEDSNNLYNIKDFTGKGYRAHDKAEGSNDAYRVYASREAATDDLLGLLSRKYPAALEAKDALQFASALKAGGYATDPAYVDKFVRVHSSLSGRSAPSEFERERPAAAPPAQPDRSLQALYAAAQGPRPPKQFAMTRTAAAAAAAADIAPLRPAGTADDWFANRSEAEAAAVKAKTEADQQGFMDIARAQFMQTMGGEVLRRLARPSFEPDGSITTEKELEGYGLEEQDAIRQGTSKAERDYLRFEIDDRKAQQKEAMKSGMGWAIAGAVVAGLPESWAAGAGAGYTLARVGMGAKALAAAGRPVAAAGSLAAENIGVGLGMTAVQDYLTPDVHLQDYVIGALGDGLGMALNAPAVLRASKQAEVDAIKSILDTAIDGKKADIEQARANLGEEATPEQVGREASRIQAERLEAEVRAHQGTVSADRKLIPDDINDELMGDAPAPKADAETVPVTRNAMDLPPIADPQAVADTTGLPTNWLNDELTGQSVVSAAALNRKALGDVGGSWESNLKAVWYGNTDLSRAQRGDFQAKYNLSHEKLVNGAKPKAVSFVRTEGLTPEHRQLATWLHKTFLPDLRVVVTDMGHAQSPMKDALSTHGDAWDIGPDISIIRVRNNPGWQHTMIHEFGHIVFQRWVHKLGDGLPDGMRAAHAAWLERYAGRGDKPAAGLSRAQDAAVRRSPTGAGQILDATNAQSPDGFIASMLDVMIGVARKVGGLNEARNQKYALEYLPNIHEFSAEQFTKYIEAAAADVLGWKPASLPDTVRQYFAALWAKFATLFNKVKQAGLIAPDARAVEFFESVRKSVKAGETKARREAMGLDPYRQEAPVQQQAMAVPAGPRTDADIARDYGLDTLAEGSSAQRARYKAMVHLYRKAEAYPMPDEARMSKLLSSSAMSWAAPTALALLKSKNPVARMVAAELLESGSGAGGRRSTAAIAKYVYERQFMGNAVNDLQRHYVTWRNARGGSLAEDAFGGKHWEEFNRRVAGELEERMAGRSAGNTAPAIEAAADVLEAAYERMRVTQKQTKTPGWASLPETSYGYMPHRMSPGKIREATPEQARVLHGVLSEQFQQIEGFDAKFSDGLASKYIDIVRKRGVAGYSAPVGVHSADAADIVEEAANAMGMSRDEANALAKRVQKAAPAHTRHRLQLDLNREYMADGKPFRLLDLFETDQLSLLRSQAGRVSGEAALVRHGIMGSTGMNLLRDALSFGTKDGKADNATLEAFDQVSAEFLGRPFGNANGKWMDRALQFNSLVSLGGIGFNQAAEVLNGAMTLGVRHALAAVGSVRRLRTEILALAKGQQVNNPIIGSLETYGAEFGADHYKLTFPFDNPHRPEVYGTDTMTAADRLLRGGTHLQGKLSLWRAITSAQERGFAEQIVHKALRMIREGGSDKNLADMGIDPGLAQAIRNELPTVAQFGPDGRLLQFDITKLSDTTAAESFVQAVHRGTRQIIQGSFIGETGKWAHHDVLRLLTQFRTFSLTAIDKQWNRQVGNHGTAKALGMLLGTMTLALPIVMARAYTASLGRSDQDEYLEKRLHPERLGREVLNYVALSGLAGDLLDVLSAAAGYEPTGGRTGANKTFVGNAIAPAIGTVNDVWQAVQNSKDGTDVHGLMQKMPFARLPWLLPAINALKPE